MKKQIVFKENGKIIKEINYTVRDVDHFQSQLKHIHKVVENKKKYNRKKVKKVLDID